MAVLASVKNLDGRSQHVEERAGAGSPSCRWRDRSRSTCSNDWSRGPGPVGKTWRQRWCLCSNIVAIFSSFLFLGPVSVTVPCCGEKATSNPPRRVWKAARFPYMSEMVQYTTVRAQGACIRFLHLGVLVSSRCSILERKSGMPREVEEPKHIARWCSGSVKRTSIGVNYLGRQSAALQSFPLARAGE